MYSQRINRFLLVIFCLSFAVISLGAGKGSDKDKAPKKEAQHLVAVSNDPKDYAGNEACATCHEDETKQYHNSPHWQTMKSSKGPGFQGCEACHGPGKAHVESPSKDNIVAFSTLHGTESSANCLKCHQQSDERSNFERSAHHRSNVACNECHSSHTPKQHDALLRQSTPTLCFTCHLEVKASFSKPFHHRVNEGLIKCTDCHNPHGGFLSRQLRATASQDQVCLKCHTEKMGPFAYEHPVVKMEGCIACHTPHGTANPRLLKRAQVNLLCLECHTFTVDTPAPAVPTFHNQAQKYQACTMCHSQIHGSNSSKFFFK